MAKIGRPSTYKKALADKICIRLSDGESLNSICKDAKMPYKWQVLRWLQSSKLKEFRAQYSQAREVQAEGLADELLEIADDGLNDWQERELASGRVIEVPDHEHINRSRLRIDTRKFLLSKLLPKKYGDKAEEAPPENTERKRYRFEIVPMSDSE